MLWLFSVSLFTVLSHNCSDEVSQRHTFVPVCALRCDYVVCGHLKDISSKALWHCFCFGSVHQATWAAQCSRLHRTGKYKWVSGGDRKKIEQERERERSVLIKTDLFKKNEAFRGVIAVNEQEESCPHLMTNDAPFHTTQENTDICLPLSHFVTH